MGPCLRSLSLPSRSAHSLLGCLRRQSLVTKSWALHPQCTPGPLTYQVTSLTLCFLSLPVGDPPLRAAGQPGAKASHLLSDGVRVMAGGAPECAKAQAACTQETRVWQRGSLSGTCPRHAGSHATEAEGIGEVPFPHSFQGRPALPQATCERREDM